MVYKQIKSKKTPSGYSVWVHFEDGVHVKPLRAIIAEYFRRVDFAENPHRTEQIKLEAEKEIASIKKAKVVD